MDISTIIFVAVGLSMDSFAVSVANGLSGRIKTHGKGIQTAIIFAVTQGIMPVIGWLAGISIKEYIEAFDHWIAFGLLAGIGLKMIWEAVRTTGDITQKELKKSTILLQAVATSIDALAVGISFAMLEISIAISAAVIAFTTLIFSLAGIYLGKYLGNKIEKTANIIGGIVLIGIGIKILLE